jgi:hypothetical protein
MLAALGILFPKAATKMYSQVAAVGDAKPDETYPTSSNIDLLASPIPAVNNGIYNVSYGSLKKPCPRVLCRHGGPCHCHCHCYCHSFDGPRRRYPKPGL